ncbi:MAG: recombination protein RecR [Candidatus Sungbacteria bacterium]|uniref:Recombination protein RecR n=1 Tax=Candidatus Sungiibacteriota bacterium TaxID=2750080 RepID=A0A931SC45_9BACT|nr:recombination protein RecR [Candidatus Sungbacteria bacterium]
MYPKAILRLAELFSKLPGIGPRQATRMAFFVLREGDNYGRTLAAAIQDVNKNIRSCPQCFRSMDVNGSSHNGLCEICADQRRDGRSICVVEKEIDIPNIEKTGAFAGVYHVLGGTISLLEKDSPERLHLKDLYRRIEELSASGAPLEVIIATNPTTEGDATLLYLERILSPLKERFSVIAISRLGRGLSLGAEVEYADEVTLENALKHRTQTS